MGLILDTSLLIDAERRGLTVDQMVAGLQEKSTEFIAVSVMSLMELAHGAIRLRSEMSRRQAVEFLEDLRTCVPVVAITDEIAVLAGRLDGQLRQSGVTIGVVDVMIAATALALHYGVATFNAKHFNAVPGLQVVEL